MGDWLPQEKRSASDAGPAWEIAFYEDVLKRQPDYVEVLHQLGSLYTSNKMYAEGLKIDQRLATLRKNDPIVRFNLACSYALLRQAEQLARGVGPAAFVEDGRQVRDDGGGAAGPGEAHGRPRGHLALAIRSARPACIGRIVRFLP